MPESAEKQVVVALRRLCEQTGGPVKSRTVGEAMGVSMPVASLRLRRAKTAGLAKQLGRGAYCWWVPIDSECDEPPATGYQRASAAVARMYGGTPVPVRRIAECEGCSVEAASSRLKEAARHGLLERIGQGPTAGWVPNLRGRKQGGHSP